MSPLKSMDEVVKANEKTISSNKTVAAFMIILVFLVHILAVHVTNIVAHFVGSALFGAEEQGNSEDGLLSKLVEKSPRNTFGFKILSICAFVLTTIFFFCGKLHMNVIFWCLFMVSGYVLYASFASYFHVN